MSGSILTITPVAAGTTQVRVSRTSEDNVTVDKNFTVTVNPQPNRAPTAVGSISAQTVTVGGSAATVDVSGNFSDPRWR